MGALRKTAPVLQPTQIIIFPVNQAKPGASEKPSAWEQFKDSKVGDLILFELKMFAMAFAALAVCACAFGGAYSAKSAAGMDIFPESSSSSFFASMSNDAPANLPHVLN